jgi:hypothetical protein
MPTNSQRTVYGMEASMNKREQAIYELLIKDNYLRCTCDEFVRETSFFQAEGHYHHCMLYQVTQAIRISLKYYGKDTKEFLEKLEQFNLAEFVYDSEGIVVNRAMEKTLKGALKAVIENISVLWSYPQIVCVDKSYPNLPKDGYPNGAFNREKKSSCRSQRNVKT